MLYKCGINVLANNIIAIIIFPLPAYLVFYDSNKTIILDKTSIFFKVEKNHISKTQISFQG